MPRELAGPDQLPAARELAAYYTNVARFLESDPEQARAYLSSPQAAGDGIDGPEAARRKSDAHWAEAAARGATSRQRRDDLKVERGTITLAGTNGAPPKFHCVSRSARPSRASRLAVRGRTRSGSRRTSRAGPDDDPDEPEPPRRGHPLDVVALQAGGRS